MTSSKRRGVVQHLSYADWTSREAAAIARCFLTGRIHSGAAPAELERALSVLYAPSGVMLLNTAHHGIEMGLRCFKQQKPGCKEVIVPAYICPSVPQTVRACGLEVRSVDVQGDLNLSAASVGQALGANTLAVIAPHMYGCPAPIAEIEQVCREAGVALIDDAAQVVGVRANGRLLGTFGEMGVLSFAQSKTIVTGVRGSGGVVLLNNPCLSEQMKAQFAELSPPHGRPLAMVDFLLNDVYGRLTGGAGHHLARMFPAWMGDDRGTVKASRISNVDANIAMVQFERLSEIIQEKIRISELYWLTLKKFPAFDFPQYGTGRYLSRVMLLIPEGVCMKLFRKNALKAGIETRLGYALEADAMESARATASMVKRLVGVPVRPAMTDKDVMSVCVALNHSLQVSSFRSV